jgi:anti-sigma B factor antagonist
MKVEKLEQGGVAILHPSGPLTGDKETDLLRSALDELGKEGNTRAVINLAQVSWINSTGIGMLIAGYKEYTSRGGKLKLCSVSENMQNVLAITRLTQVFEVFANEKEAIASFAAA